MCERFSCVWTLKICIYIYIYREREREREWERVGERGTYLCYKSIERKGDVTAKDLNCHPAKVNV